MKKIILTIILMVLLVILVLTVGCQEKIELSELQVEACNSADEYGTCDSRLEEVGIAIPEECCEVLGKCC